MVTLDTSVKAGLAYPWQKPVRLWYILWILVPIFGWFALYGYSKKIIQSLVKGEYMLPQFGSPVDNFVIGLKLFVFLIPTVLVISLMEFIPYIGWLVALLLYIFIVPMLIVNLFVKETFGAAWELEKVFSMVFENLWDYIVTLVKTFVFTVVYIVMSLVLVGIPGLMFGMYYYYANFYQRHK